MRVKIHGAGSIGNHMAHAARSLGWDVVVCDIDQRALERMRAEIFPARYGAWDTQISLCLSAVAPRGGFDLIHIGTPPGAHLPLALEALEEGPRAILIEKPACPPSMEGAETLRRHAEGPATRIFVGYDHVVGAAAQLAQRLLAEGVIGELQTIDVEFREHWAGIFAAHPWLRGPADSYLGSWEQGGGASGEHSHAANLWQHFARASGAGEVVQVSAMLTYLYEGGRSYDTVCSMDLRTDTGLSGRVIQDVVTRPPRKRATLHGRDGIIEWVNAHGQERDAVLVHRSDGSSETHEIAKTRPDDFIQELRHIEGCLASGAPSPLELRHGLDTMLVVAAAHRAEREGRRISVDRGRGLTLDALR